MKIHLTEYLEETLRRVPEKTAVIDRGHRITFAQLEKASKCLAQLLLDRLENVRNRPVAVLMEKGIGSILSDLGILYSGNAYMNLDGKTPQQRIEGILQQVEPAAIITTSKWADKAADFDGPVIRLDELDWDRISFEQSRIKAVLAGLIDTDPSCIINTSGSTGIPKGVVLNHKSFFDFTEWALETMKFREDEVIGSLSPSVFDIYSFELCLLMAKGSTIVILPDELAAFPAKMLQLVREEKVTFLFWVPTIMVNIANMGLLDKIPLETLRMVWFAGEVFPTKQLNIWRRSLPNTKFVNMYGPIEITLDCTYFVVDRPFEDEEPIPIGRPCRNTDILLLDENDQRITEPEQEGELCVRGTSLAMGYYQNPGKTAAAFTQNPLNQQYPELIYRTGDIACYNRQGELMFRGRRDTLVKHSGYRIELGEIEHVLINNLKIIKNGCVVYDHAKKEIVLFYEAEEEKSVADLKDAMGKALPRYMIPTRYCWMKELPRNTNGKIDRLSLRKTIEKGGR